MSEDGRRYFDDRPEDIFPTKADHELRDKIAAAFLSAHRGWKGNEPDNHIIANPSDARALAAIAVTTIRKHIPDDVAIRAREAGLTLENEELKEKVAQAYQVVGYLLHVVDENEPTISNDEAVRALDYFSNDGHSEDFLPWPKS